MRLIWAYGDDRQLSLWQDIRQRPRIIDSKSEANIERIVGHYQVATGEYYYAIKWKNYACPTWELEANLSCFDSFLTEYTPLMNTVR